MKITILEFDVHLMKVLLIYPYFLEKRVHTEDMRVVPMGLYFIGAVLKEKGFDVEILNFCELDRSSPEIRKSLIEKKPDIIGFSILHGNRWGGIEIAGIAREIDPSVPIVFGGAGATFLWKHLMTHFKTIDYAVVGEGEYPFLQLAESIKNKEKEKISHIKGIAFRKKDEIIFTGRTEAIPDLDSLPIPAKYFIYNHLSLTRGCPGNCTFCGSPRIWGRKVRFHSAKYFVDHLELLYKKGVRFFYVSDDTFTLKEKLVIQICKMILERNLRITWAAISHVNHVSEEMLYWMRLSGCSQISYGVESGSEKIRNRLGKNIKTDAIEKAFEITIKYGILARAYFIYGSPGETWKTIGESINLIRRIKPLSAIFYILDIFPGTVLYDEFKKNFRVSDDIWLNRIEDILYFENDPELSQEMILAFGEKLRAGFYKNLHSFADDISLVDKKELVEKHADFFSRLAMTFSHGDYAGIDAILNREKTAEKLYWKSLDYKPNHRAFLGLGILLQKNRKFKDAAEILTKGLAYFPDSEPLNTCLGITYMNLNEYEKALPLFLKFPESRQSAQCASDCQRAMERSSKAEKSNP
jgi:radical SAM superfamily enzyme YgiQ (UPF0313 family)